MLFFTLQWTTEASKLQKRCIQGRVPLNRNVCVQESEWLWLQSLWIFGALYISHGRISDTKGLTQCSMHQIGLLMNHRGSWNHCLEFVLKHMHHFERSPGRELATFFLPS